MLLTGLFLAAATGVALPSPIAGSHWHSPAAAHVDRGQGRGYPVESGRPRQHARVPHPRAVHTSLRQVRESAWVLVVRPQHRRLLPAVVPAQERMLEPGFLAHRTGAVRNGYVQIYDDRGKSWVSIANLQPAREPAGWDKLVLKIHPGLQRRLSIVPKPRVSTIPLPPTTGAAPSTAPVLLTPPVAAVATPAPAGPYISEQRTPEGSLRYWGAVYGVSGDWLVRVATCESGLQPGVANPTPVWDGEHAQGLAQFIPSTYAHFAALAGETRSVWDSDASARVMAYAFSVGGSGQWACN